MYFLHLSDPVLLPHCFEAYVDISECHASTGVWILTCRQWLDNGLWAWEEEASTVSLSTVSVGFFPILFVNIITVFPASNNETLSLYYRWPLLQCLGLKLSRISSWKPVGDIFRRRSSA